jgi:HAD superfamily hydrolase (TIGR01509 family)
VIKAIVFDFDGVIIDTEQTEFSAWQEVFAGYGCELSLQRWADCIGRPRGYFDPVAHLEKLSGAGVERESILSRHRQRMQVLNDALPVLPGVAEMIAVAGRLGIGLAIASSSDHAWVRGHLQRLGLLQAFDVLVCAEDTDRHKPSPEPYLCAVSRLECCPDQALAFEDSPNGIAAAKAAGLYCVAIPNAVTRSLELDGADLHLNALSDMQPEKLLARFA